MKKISVFIGSRANYSSIKSVLFAIKKSKKLDLKIILGASALVSKYGELEKIILKDGFRIDTKIMNLVEGENPLSMSKTIGIGIIELSTILNKIKPDFVITVGDRYETLATSISSVLSNFRLIHTMGGEITGTIDESIRHATSKLAHLHFVATKKARERVIKLGEDPRYVFNVGCPRIDLVKNILKKRNNINENEIFRHGVGNRFSLKKNFLIISQHPVTTEYEKSMSQILTTLNAAKKVNLPTIVIWPNPDAGSDGISRGIRIFREKNPKLNFFFIKMLEIENYVKLLNITSCLIGNSSSGIREGCFIGTPCVNIGTRQNNREFGKNVIHTDNSEKKIIAAIKKQILRNKKYKSDKIYGSGNAASKIVQYILKSKPSIQKKLNY